PADAVGRITTAAPGSSRIVDRDARAVRVAASTAPSRQPTVTATRTAASPTSNQPSRKYAATAVIPSIATKAASASARRATRAAATMATAAIHQKANMPNTPILTQTQSTELWGM